MQRLRTLIVGYGNRLRGDDGVGPAVAEIVQSWKLPAVRVLAVHQLVPELVAELAVVERALFVDASVETSQTTWAARIIEPRQPRQAPGHCYGPEHLLAFARALDGRAPEAWMLTVPAFANEFGETITDAALDQIQGAIAWMRQWLEFVEA